MANKKSEKPHGFDIDGERYVWGRIINHIRRYLGVPHFTKKKDLVALIRENFPDEFSGDANKIIKEFFRAKVYGNFSVCLNVPYDSPRMDAPIKRQFKPISRYAGAKSEYVPSKDFFKTKKWRQVRYLALRNSNGRCACCGASSGDGVVLHVDHIQPRWSRPDLSLKLDNLQVLCADCNLGKGAWDDTDWR